MKAYVLGKKAAAFAPASTGNVSVGFDLLGAALRPVDGTLLGDKVTVEFTQEEQLFNKGKYHYVCPRDNEQNLAWIAYRHFIKALALAEPAPNVTLTLEKNLPVGSGLGSSACSVVASLTALNKLFDFPFSDEQLLVLMGQVEAGASGDLHYDNVAPSYFGGLQLMTRSAENPVISLPVPPNWYWVVAFPGFSLPTKEAREVLPVQYSKKDVILNAQNLATFVAYLYQGEEKSAAQSIEDVVAEPYRATLINKFTEVKQSLLGLGALAVGISGAGPTLFCITMNEKDAKSYQTYLEDNYINEQGFVHICHCSELGAKSLRVE